MGGPSPKAGRIELYGENKGYICDDRWEDEDSMVICRMLGIRLALHRVVNKRNAFMEGK